MKRVTLIVLGVALLGGLLALFFRPSENLEDKPNAAPKKVPSPVSETILPDLEDLPEPVGTTFLSAGDLRQYRYQSLTSVQVEVHQGKTDMTLRATGEMTVRTYQISETVLQGYQFQPVTLLANNGMVGDVGDFRSLQAQLEQEFYIRRDLSGKILSIHFEKGVDKEARNLLRGLLSPFEVVLGGQEEEAWDVRGDDPTGRFLASYEVKDRSEKSLVLLRRKIYEDLYFSGIPNSLETDESPLEVQAGGETHIHLDTAMQLTKIIGKEYVEMEGKNDRMSLEVSTRMEVFAVLIKMERNSPGVLARASDLGEGGLPEDSFVDFSPETTMEKFSTVDIKDLDSLVDGLVQAVASGEWYKEAPQVYMALRELMETSGEARKKIMELLANGDLPQEVLQTLADALGSTTEGWKEILSLMENDEVDTGRRLILIRSLGLVPRPGEEVVALLSSLAASEDDAFSAIMAIRSLGLSAGIPDNLDQSAGLAQELIPLLGGPVERDVQVLNALGNAGSIESLPAILGLAGSSSEEVRAAVAVAVRKLEAPEVEPLLVKLAGDSSVSVRLSAVSILVERDGPNTSTLLKKICSKDPNEGVRLEAIEYFAGCSSQNIAAVQVLTEVSQNDPSENVRTYASNALKNMATE